MSLDVKTILVFFRAHFDAVYLNSLNSSQILGLKCTKYNFRWGSDPDSADRRSSDPRVGWGVEPPPHTQTLHFPQRLLCLDLELYHF